MILRWIKWSAIFLSFMCGYSLAEQSNTVISAQSKLDQLDKHYSTDPLRQAIITINRTNASITALRQAVTYLEHHLQREPNDNVSKIYYGYGLLFLATNYQKNKNYFRAAELSKQGFFYIDEAAESEEDNWRLTFLRARMDAFVPKENGRCVIALKDTLQLFSNEQFLAELKPLLIVMRARAFSSCNQHEKSEQLWQQLAEFGAGAHLFYQFKQQIPFLMQVEIDDILIPLLERR